MTIKLATSDKEENVLCSAIMVVHLSGFPGYIEHLAIESGLHTWKKQARRTRCLTENAI